MASARSIGRLFIDIEARTAKLETDMAKVRTIVQGATQAVKEQGDATAKLRDHSNVMVHQLTQRLAGMLALFTIIKREVTEVYNNIERIPGIPAQTVSSIVQMKENIAESKNMMQGWIASAMAGLSEMTTHLGAAASGVVRFAEKFWQLEKQTAKGGGAGAGVFKNLTDAWKAASSELTMPTAHEEQAAAIQRLNDVTNRQAILEVQTRINEARRQETLAAMDTGQQINELRRLADIYEKSMTGHGGDRLKQLQSEVQMLQLRRDANQRETNLLEQLKTAQRSLNTAISQGDEQLVSTAGRVDVLKTKLESLAAKLPNMYVVTGAIDEAGNMIMRERTLKELKPEEMQQMVETLKLMTGVQLRLNSALRANGELARDLGNALANGFGRAILSGEKLRDVLRGLLGDLLQIILQRTILNPLADFFTAGILKVPGMKAGGGPISGPTIVGEKGPELLVGTGYGTVVPNEQLRGGRGGANYYIDAKGADTAAVARLEALLLGLAGPGVVERRSINAMLNGKWRGGSLGSSLA